MQSRCLFFESGGKCVYSPLNPPNMSNFKQIWKYFSSEYPPDERPCWAVYFSSLLCLSIFPRWQARLPDRSDGVVFIWSTKSTLLTLKWHSKTGTLLLPQMYDHLRLKSLITQIQSLDFNLIFNLKLILIKSSQWRAQEERKWL